MLAAKTVSLLSALVLAYSDLAYAQARPERYGVWTDLAVGWGWVQMSSDTLRGRNQNDTDFIFALGWTFGSHVRAGLGVAAWAHPLGAGKEIWINRYEILVYYYPLTRHSLFLEAAAGPVDYSVVHASGETADITYFSGNAWGPTLGVGWDLSPVGPFSIRPRLTYSYGPPRTLHSGDTLIATGWKLHVVSLGLGVVMHPADSR